MTAPALHSILYVEDDPDIQTIAQISLEEVGGFSVRICNSGIEAFNVINAGFTPDLMLLDVMMPEADGPMILDALRRLPETRSTPAVFVTAKVQPNEIAYYKSLGVLGVIAKPFDPMLLPEQVQQLWRDAHD
ncbi:CheY chemotaxis protein or a CheY-like REC (receiver) domain [Noviherbaspirillum humi]|uniref:CheY chemotaxis protein or a CheY-like REC (Receiver) domain n=1 Tax=Noviherbaspirillum humi TaxID=1688639 RepID=A0A239JZW8_9BURK|nr:response regulator [Noviherbaspirillum humi]SNT10963.1 CheY chemotaxis protein or a CheY-like REC (receiver) domain [Noviherbaspirillum humi]